jgi:uncharacterized surface protein with fasciclin (FAS1) repeats
MYREDLENILAYHVAAGETFSSDSFDGQMIEMIQGDTVEVTQNSTGIFINDAAVVVPFDVVASNGVLHGIDKVLVPPSTDLAALTEECLQGDILNVLPDLEEYSTLLSLVDMSNEAQEVLSVGAFPRTVTLFAPTNDAFAASPFSECLLLPENNDVLTAILMYHIGDDYLPTDELENGQEIETYYSDGSIKTIKVTIDASVGVLLNDEARLIDADIDATKGIIQGIDGVLVPDSFDLVGFLEGCGP